MDALTAIHNRRSAKGYTEEPIPQEAIEEILNAAYDASSGANYQPRQYVIVTDRASLDALADVHGACRWLKTAQAAIAIVADSAKSRYWLEDSCVAAQNMWIAATALGVGMAWSAIYQSDRPEESDRREGLVRDILSIPLELRVPIVLGLGMQAAPPPERKRPALEEMVHWNRYGSGNKPQE